MRYSWRLLLEAAKDQPSPTKELAAAIEKCEMTEPELKKEPKNEKKGYIKCFSCEAPNHARQKNCTECGYDLMQRFLARITG